MEREDRYLVWKYKDLKEVCTREESKLLDEISVKIQRHRLKRRVNQFLPCVVVEKDWPKYEQVWKMIEQRVDNENS